MPSHCYHLLNQPATQASARNIVRLYAATGKFPIHGVRQWPDGELRAAALTKMDYRVMLTWPDC
jgi:hypothetical protein